MKLPFIGKILGLLNWFRLFFHRKTIGGQLRRHPHQDKAGII